MTILELKLNLPDQLARDAKAADPLPPMSESEIQAEIVAYRAGKRAASGS